MTILMAPMTRSEARQIVANAWRAWATAKGLEHDRPSENDLWDFYRDFERERWPVLAALGSRGDRWSLLVRALAHHGYVPERTIQAQRGDGEEGGLPVPRQRRDDTNEDNGP
jgi:hypothetical protein